jgi:hypothetical protein
VINKSDWHPRLLAITLEDSWFAPIKEITKMNIVQYQGPTTIYNPGQQKDVNVDPQALRQAIFQFKLTDGQTPTEKLMNFNIMNQIAQIGMAVPALNAQYDIIGMLVYSWKTQGADWLDQFKRTPEQAKQYLAATQAQTNAETPVDKKANAAQTAQTPPQLPTQGASS